MVPDFICIAKRVAEPLVLIYYGLVAHNISVSSSACSRGSEIRVSGCSLRGKMHNGDSIDTQAHSEKSFRGNHTGG